MDIALLIAILVILHAVSLIGVIDSVWVLPIVGGMAGIVFTLFTWSTMDFAAIPMLVLFIVYIFLGIGDEAYG